MSNRNYTDVMLLCARHCVRCCLTMVPETPWVPAGGWRLRGGEVRAALGEAKPPTQPHQHRHHLLNWGEKSSAHPNPSSAPARPFPSPPFCGLSVPFLSFLLPCYAHTHTPLCVHTQMLMYIFF